MGVVSIEGERAVLGVNLGSPIVTNRAFVAYLCESNALFPNDWGGLVSLVLLIASIFSGEVIILLQR